jgi:hypothetical protein
LPGVLALPVASRNLSNLQGVCQRSLALVEFDKQPEALDRVEPLLSVDYVAGRIGTRLHQADVQPAEPLNVAEQMRLVAAPPPQLIRRALNEEVVVGRLA